jgi:hypothetical protein
MLCEASSRVTASLKNVAEALRQHRNESAPDKKHTYLQMEQCWSVGRWIRAHGAPGRPDALRSALGNWSKRARADTGQRPAIKE